MIPSPTHLGLFARATARRTAIGVAGGALVAVGAGFLLAAVWLVLAQAFGPLAACLVIAALLMGAGALLMLVRPPAPRLSDPMHRLGAAGLPVDPRLGAGGLPPLAAAFVFGLSVALQARARPR
jgi:hypothetical protein